jgi:hypothetical protein
MSASDEKLRFRESGMVDEEGSYLMDPAGNRPRDTHPDAVRDPHIRLNPYDRFI